MAVWIFPYTTFLPVHLSKTLFYLFGRIKKPTKTIINSITCSMMICSVIPYANKVFKSLSLRTHSYCYHAFFTPFFLYLRLNLFILKPYINRSYPDPHCKFLLKFEGQSHSYVSRVRYLWVRKFLYGLVLEGFAKVCIERIVLHSFDSFQNLRVRSLMGLVGE